MCTRGCDEKRGFPPFAFLLGWSLLRDVVDAQSRPALILRLVVILGAAAVAVAVGLKLELEQILRTERGLIYARILADKDHDDKESASMRSGRADPGTR